jgi:hypothetical protein
MLDAAPAPRLETAEIVSVANNGMQSDPRPTLSRDQLRQLEAALHQLTECRRKLDEALDDRL